VRATVFRSNGHEFLSLSGEAPAANTPAEEMHALVRDMEAELMKHDLFLANTVRTRLWARDRESRDGSSKARRDIFGGALRSVSSSFIAPDMFESEARVSLDLLAMRPSAPDVEKRLREYDPPIVPLRYLSLDDVVFLSGVTSVSPTLEEQIEEITGLIRGSLQEAGVSWERVFMMSCFLHRSQTVESLMGLLKKNIPCEIPFVEIGFAEGYSTPGKLVEVETTARGGSL
jgi:enamine deaminase RidA (YjgF/YER057c/UK114 family)